MAAKWIKVVAIDDLQPDKKYFIGRNFNEDHPYLSLWSFAAVGLNGKRCMSVKPGIASQYRGDESLKTYLREHQDLRAIAVPDDAARRWRARQRVF